MNSCGEREMIRQLQVLGRELRRRDFVLIRCYVAAIAMALVFLFLPLHLGRIGGVLIVMALSHMLCKILAAWGIRQFSRSADDPSHRELERIRARIAVTQSPFYLLPFIVGANLVFMALPMASDPLLEAIMDCTFLGGTVLLFFASFWFNQYFLKRHLEMIRLTPSPERAVPRPDQP